MLKRLYHWILSWADSRWGATALFILAFAESSFFPIPPDVLLIALCLGCTTKAFRYALICTAGSVLGALAGYAIGHFLWLTPSGEFTAVADFFFRIIPGFTHTEYDKISEVYNQYNFWVVFTAGFTPIPYKLITITGGKWTTYRRMAEDTVDKAIELNLLEKKACVTKKFRIHGYQLNPDLNNHLYIYGSDIQAIKTLMQSDPAMAEKLHPKYDYTVAEVVWAVREEMALNVEDILARRVRLLFLDARVAAEVAPKVARIVAKELGYDQAWIDGQVKEFTDLAGHYILE